MADGTPYETPGSAYYLCKPIRGEAEVSARDLRKLWRRRWERFWLLRFNNYRRSTSWSEAEEVKSWRLSRELVSRYAQLRGWMQ